jgi:hypothetical protein
MSKQKRPVPSDIRPGAQAERPKAARADPGPPEVRVTIRLDKTALAEKLAAVVDREVGKCLGNFFDSVAAKQKAARE